MPNNLNGLLYEPTTFTVDSLLNSNPDTLSGFIETAPAPAMPSSYDAQRQMEVDANRIDWQNAYQYAGKRSYELGANLSGFVADMGEFFGGEMPFTRSLEDILRHESDTSAYLDMQLWDRAKKSLSDDSQTKTDAAKRFMSFIVNEAFGSSPYMVSTLNPATFTATIASESKRLADESIELGAEDEGFITNAKALPAAMAIMYMEKLGVNKMLTGVGKDAVKKVVSDSVVNTLTKRAGKVLTATTVESLTEGAQEAIEYYYTHALAGKEADNYQALDQVLAGMVAGGGMAGGVNVATQTVEAITDVKAKADRPAKQYGLSGKTQKSEEIKFDQARFNELATKLKDDSITPEEISEFNALADVHPKKKESAVSVDPATNETTELFPEPLEDGTIAKRTDAEGNVELVKDKDVSVEEKKTIVNESVQKELDDIDDKESLNEFQKSFNATWSKVDPEVKKEVESKFYSKKQELDLRDESLDFTSKNQELAMTMDKRKKKTYGEVHLDMMDEIKSKSAKQLKKMFSNPKMFKGGVRKISLPLASNPNLEAFVQELARIEYNYAVSRLKQLTGEDKPLVDKTKPSKAVSEPKAQETAQVEVKVDVDTESFGEKVTRKEFDTKRPEVEVVKSKMKKTSFYDKFISVIPTIQNKQAKVVKEIINTNNPEVQDSMMSSIFEVFYDIQETARLKKQTNNEEELQSELESIGIPQAVMDSMNKLQAFFLKDSANKIGSKVVSTLGLSIDENMPEVEYRNAKKIVGGRAIEAGIQAGFLEKFYIDEQGNIKKNLPKVKKGGSMPLHFTVIRVNPNKLNLKNLLGEIEKLNYRIPKVGEKGKLIGKTMRNTDIELSDTRKKAAENQAGQAYKFNKKLMELFNGLNAKQKNMLVGNDDKEIHPNEIDNEKSKRDGIVRNMSNTIKFYAKLKDKELPFFYDYFVASNGRAMIDQNVANIQADKAFTRWVIDFHKPDVLKAESLQSFKDAVLQGFGEDPDKMSQEQKDKAYQDYYIEFSENDNIPMMIGSIVKDMHGLKTALTFSEFVQYEKEHGTHVGFKSNLTLEADGVTNGTAITLLQNLPTIVKEFGWDDTETWLNRVGIFLDKRENMFKFRANPNNVDTYVSMKDALNKNLSNLPVIKVLKEQNGEGLTRNLMKSPVMTFFYSSGENAISRKVAYGIYSEMLGNPAYNKIFNVDFTKAIDSKTEERIIKTLAKQIGKPVWNQLNEEFGFMEFLKSKMQEAYSSKATKLNEGIAQLEKKVRSGEVSHKEYKSELRKMKYEHSVWDSAGQQPINLMQTESSTAMDSKAFAVFKSENVVIPLDDESAIEKYTHVLPFVAHFTDSGIMADMFAGKQENVYQIFDAVVSGTNNVTSIEKLYNKIFFEYNKDNRFIEDFLGTKESKKDFDKIAVVHQMVGGADGQYYPKGEQTVEDVTDEKDLIEYDELKNEPVYRSKKKTTKIKNFVKSFDLKHNKEALLSVFDNISNFDAVENISAEHKQYLKDTVSKISEFLAQPVQDRIEKINIAKNDLDYNHGEYDPVNGDINMNVGKMHNPMSMSAVEVFTHELVHKATSTAIKTDKKLRLHIERAMKTVIESMDGHKGYEELMQHDRNHQIGVMFSDDAVKTAIERYDHIFDSPEEFVAHYVTNEGFRKVVNGFNYKKKKKSQGFIGILENLFDKVLDVIRIALGNREYNKNVAKDLDILMDEIYRVNIGKKSELQASVDAMYDAIPDLKIDKFNRFLNQKILKTIKVVSENDGVKAVGRAMSQNSMAKRLASKQWFQSTIADVVGHSESIQNVIDIASGKREDNDRQALNARQLIANKIVEWTKGASNEEQIAMKLSLIDTDIASLGLEIDAIKDMMMQPQLIQNEIDKIESKIKNKAKGYKQNNFFVYAVEQAEGLGIFMATGNAVIQDQMLNAENIASARFLPNPNIEPIGGITTDIDKLATLYALKHTRPEAKQRTAFAIQKAPEGVMSVIKYTQLQQKLSKRQLFDKYGEGHNYIKGYTKELFDQSIESKIDSVDNANKLMEEGWKLVSMLDTGNVLIDGVRPVKRALYVRDNIETRYTSGIAGNIQMNARGTNITETSAYSPGTNVPIDVTTELVKINKAGGSKHRIEFKRKKLTTGGQRYMIPLISPNAKDGIVNYRYMMNKKTKATVLGSDHRLPNVIGEFEASISRKLGEKDIDKYLFSNLVKDMNENMSKEPDNFVRLTPDDANPSENDINWAMLNPKTRRFILEQTKGQPFYIRKEIVDKVIGFKDKTISNIVGSERKKIKRWVRLSEKIMQDIASIARVNIVIKTFDVIFGNILSNEFFLLTRFGIRIDEATKWQSTAISGMNQLRDDEAKLKKIIMDKQVGNKVNDNEMKLLQKSIANNPVKKMVDAGLFQAIVDDTDVEFFDTDNYILNKMEIFSRRLPTKLRKFGQEIYIAENTDTFKALAKITQYSDFVARYAVIEKLKQQGWDEDKAISHVRDTFVNYATEQGAVLKYINDIGLWRFTKYAMRIPRVIWDYAKQKPATLMAEVMVQDMTIDVPDVPSSLITPSDIVSRLSISPTDDIGNAITPHLLSGLDLID